MPRSRTAPTSRGPRTPTEQVSPYEDPPLVRQVAALLHDELSCRCLGECEGPSDAHLDVARSVLRLAGPVMAAAELRSYADMLERELVCCDAYTGKGNRAGHGHCICYWGGAAAAGARDVAAGLAALPGAVRPGTTGP